MVNATSCSNWFFCCEVLPELPSVQGWVEAMTSLGRLIFFDQPGTGVSDPVTAGARPTLESSPAAASAPDSRTVRSSTSNPVLVTASTSIPLTVWFTW